MKLDYLKVETAARIFLATLFAICGVMEAVGAIFGNRASAFIAGGCILMVYVIIKKW